MESLWYLGDGGAQMFWGYWGRPLKLEDQEWSKLIALLDPFYINVKEYSTLSLHGDLLQFGYFKPDYP